MTKACLTVVPLGGLCNRLRVTLSARFVSETVNLPVRVCWDGKDAECRAAFTDLFVPIDTTNFRITRRPWHCTPVYRSNLHLPALPRLFLFDAQQKNFDPRRHGDIDDWLRRYRRLYVSGCFALKPYPPAATALLRPLPRLQQRIDAVTAGFDEHTVGVHIRRTDHLLSMSVSTDEAFLSAMYDYVRADSRTHFFLATDDDALRRRLSAEFGSRLTTLPCGGGRDTLGGIEQAVVELWCLAATTRILGSYQSSFTDTAAELGGIPLTIAGE